MGVLLAPLDHRHDFCGAQAAITGKESARNAGVQGLSLLSAAHYFGVNSPPSKYRRR